MPGAPAAAGSQMITTGTRIGEERKSHLQNFCWKKVMCARDDIKIILWRREENFYRKLFIRQLSPRKRKATC
jgi:hypothetical protein